MSTGSPVKLSPGPSKLSSGAVVTQSGHSPAGAQQALGGGASSVPNSPAEVGQLGISSGTMTSFSPGAPKSSLMGGTFPSYTSVSAQAICMGPETIYPSLSQTVSAGSNISSYHQSSTNKKTVQVHGVLPSFDASAVQSGLAVGSMSGYSSGTVRTDWGL